MGFVFYHNKPMADRLLGKEVRPVNKQVMRLNKSVVCDGCATNVNPYVLKTEWDRESGKEARVRLECPTCGYEFWMSDSELR